LGANKGRVEKKQGIFDLLIPGPVDGIGVTSYHRFQLRKKGRGRGLKMQAPHFSRLDPKEGEEKSGESKEV